MAELNKKDILSTMLTAFWSEVKNGSGETQDTVKFELNKLAGRVIDISNMSISGDLDIEQAKLHLEMQKNAAETIILADTGMKQISIRKGINAALSIARKVVNIYIGWPLL